MLAFFITCDLTIAYSTDTKTPTLRLAFTFMLSTQLSFKLFECVD